MQDRTAQLPRATASLSAAECAARTGLTTRALRIYERRGLITPPRTARGWRRYGEGELTRLNSIAMLKLAGFTLTKIRTMLTADHAPTLEQLLRAQLQDWKSRQMQAETGQRVACAALQRLQGSQVVPLDELCQLVRSAVLENSTSAFQQLTRYIGEQHPQLLHADGTKTALHRCRRSRPIKSRCARRSTRRSSNYNNKAWNRGQRKSRQ